MEIKEMTIEQLEERKKQRLEKPLLMAQEKSQKRSRREKR